MEVNLEKSRSVIVNRTVQLFQKKRYDSHIDALNRARSCYQNTEMPYLANISRYKEANKTVSKIFDHTVIENRALIRRLVQIEEKSWHKDSTDKKNATRNVFCSEKLNRETQQKKISWENGILHRKLVELNKKKLNTRKLKKLYREHDRLVFHAQKIRA